MNILVSPLFLSLAALGIGAIIGWAFGAIQSAAVRHQEQRLREGKFKSGWVLLPGSGGRVAFLLIVLALVQLICPLLFANGIQWWISGGVALGYGCHLFRQFRQKQAALAG